jgi:hypothetical protein
MSTEEYKNITTKEAISWYQNNKWGAPTMGALFGFSLLHQAPFLINILGFTMGFICMYLWTKNPRNVKYIETMRRNRKAKVETPVTMAMSLLERLGFVGVMTIPTVGLLLSYTNVLLLLPVFIVLIFEYFTHKKLITKLHGS